MARRVGGVFAGMIVGVIVIALVTGLSSVVYPPPADLDLQDTAALERYIQTLPVGAFAFVLVAHALGSFLASLTCAAIVRKRWVPGSIIIGTLFLVAGIANLFMIPHPIWFAGIDVLIYLPCSLLGTRRTHPDAAPSPSASNPS